jgi:hypothetical protein
MSFEHYREEHPLDSETLLQSAESARRMESPTEESPEITETQSESVTQEDLQPK